MKTYHTITINYTEYLLPEDMDRKEQANLVATLAALRPIDSRGRKIADEWTSAHHLGNMKVALGSSTYDTLHNSEEQATAYLDYLEQVATNPESVF